LRKLHDLGRDEDVLDCVVILLDYGSEIFNFPPEGLIDLLANIAHDRALHLKQRIESEHRKLRAQ